ncbi:hypothetical protein [Pontibacter ruber]|uniref:Phage integrase family protein n=1 Tax=Pontibacter ruber TaxID=1343895 RepID=A0ABW5CZ21_9BACT|nr:hypothetical protein [Pontibacter ruber]
MKKPGLTIHLRPNKDKTKANVTIRYTYARTSHPFPLGITIDLKKWDKKRNRLDFKYAESTDINKVINDEFSALELLSNKCIKLGIEPTVEEIKGHYAHHIYWKNKLKQDAEVNRPLFLEQAKKHRSEIEQLEAQIEILKRRERKNLRHAGALPEPLIEATAVKPMMLDLLYEYIELKTGIPLQMKAKHGCNKLSGTDRQLRSWANTFVGFTQSKEAKKAGLTFDLQTLDEKFYNTYASYLMNPEGHDYFNNTFGRHISKLKTFLNWVEVNKLVAVDRRYKGFKVVEEEKEIVCLSKEDIDLLWEYKPKNRVHNDANNYQKYIDFTVFSFFTGLRISDVRKAKGFRFVNNYLLGRTQKTKNQFKVPLNVDDRVLEILLKYNYDMNLFSEVEYNRTIKIIMAEFCNHNNIHQHPITITRYKLKEAFVTQHTFAELYTSHCNRRGFVSYMYDFGLELRDIKEIIGTKSDKELMKYLKLKTNHLTNKIERKKALLCVA